MANNKIRIRLKSFDHKILDNSAEKIIGAAKKSGAQVVGPVPLPTEKEIYTILRAVHKYKDSREQFEIRTHKRKSYTRNCRCSNKIRITKWCRYRNQIIRKVNGVTHERNLRS